MWWRRKRKPDRQNEVDETGREIRKAAREFVAKSHDVRRASLNLVEMGAKVTDRSNTTVASIARLLNQPGSFEAIVADSREPKWR